MLVIDACVLDNTLGPKSEGGGDLDSMVESDTEDSAPVAADTCDAAPDWSLEVV